MKKKRSSRTLGLVKRLFNVRQWSDFDRTKRGFAWVVEVCKNLFIPQPKKVEESFKEAQKRLGLTDEAITTRKKGLLLLSIVMLLFAIFMLGYAIYQIYFANFAAFFVSLVVMGIALVLAFRYHFWYFQLKVRKLGCSFHDWFKQGLMGGR